MAGIDLNLLRSLDALLELRGVTAAARRTGVTQPSMSATLARLRRHFDDELLVRAGRDLQLTALGLRLRDPVRAAVLAADRVFESAGGFTPATTTREFRLVLSDYAMELIVPRLLPLLEQEAPRARLRMSAVNDQSLHPSERFSHGDLLLAPHGLVTGMSHEDLYQDVWVCIVSADNTEVGDAVTVEQLSRLWWVAAHDGPLRSTTAARALRTLGVEPRIRVVVESFLAVPRLVADSDRMAVVQSRQLDLVPPGSRIRPVALPFELAPLVHAMWWHPLYDTDQEHVFFRDLVSRATAWLRSDGADPWSRR